MGAIVVKGVCGALHGLYRGFYAAEIAKLTKAGIIGQVLRIPGKILLLPGAVAIAAGA